MEKNIDHTYSDMKIFEYMDELKSIVDGSSVNCCVLEVFPSRSCNQNCYFCSSKKSRSKVEMLSIERFREALDELQTVKSIIFSGGGESLLNPNIELMFQECIDRKINYGLITNGTMLQTIDKKYIYELSFLRISLYGRTDVEYFSITGNMHGFKMLLACLEWLNSLPDLAVKPTANIVFEKVELDGIDELYELDTFCKEYSEVFGKYFEFIKCSLDIKETWTMQDSVRFGNVIVNPYKEYDVEYECRILNIYKFLAPSGKFQSCCVRYNASLPDYKKGDVCGTCRFKKYNKIIDDLIQLKTQKDREFF